MVEGVFPKADGGVWFASDVNRLYGLGLTTDVGTTAEGTFPKSDGDILYGSEVNKLHGLGWSTTIGTTAEGTFPKVDGDNLYASEVNDFNTDIAALQDKLVNQISSVTPSSSGTFTDLANMFDGDQSTYTTLYCTGYNTSAQAIWDMGEIKTGLDIWWNIYVTYTATTYNNDFVLSISDDNVTYTTIASCGGGQSGSPAPDTVQGFEFGYSGRYIKMKVRGAISGGSGYNGETFAHIYYCRVLQT